ncbi:MAG: glycerate-2-kinase family protein [Candidatus Paceibacterota bacterium]
MDQKRIKNFENLATTENRKLALLVAEAGLDALDTGRVIASSVTLNGNILQIQGESFDLSKFKNIKVVGFGKASCTAALALEKILGSRIGGGAVIGLEKNKCEYVETFAGTHPKPSAPNILAGQKIFELVKNSTIDDLIIALVSGGGSALLCSSAKESEQGIKLYESFLKTGKTISVLNTVRKHLSILKGGGLAEIAYPATVIGLIFSDVPGDNFGDVASGPTYKDVSTVADAEKIIADNNLGDFDLMETPKDDKYFEKFIISFWFLIKPPQMLWC